MDTPSFASPERGTGAEPGSTRPVLDLRELPPPEPLQRALEAAVALTPGEGLEVLTRFRPAHLIDQLNARGFAHECQARGAAGWQVTIWRRA
jgi:uncharacterized protein (DUF2249 family)